VGETEAGTRAERPRSLTALLRQFAKVVFLSDVAQAINERVEGPRQALALRHWERSGRALPPPHLVKQRTVVAYAHRFGTRALVETGTYLGAMIRATRSTFDRIISVELDHDLYERARQKLAEAGRVTILNGDSAQVLPGILAQLHEPALFWLDAHHSGVLTAHGRLASPVMLELQHILGHTEHDHVVLIDDAHEFVGQGGYPTIPELRAFVAGRRPSWLVEMEDDIIRVHREWLSGSQ